MTSDIIDRLADVAPGSRVDGLRQRRAQARTNSQASYDALFTAPDQTGVSRTERLAVATFVSSLHGAARAHDHYRGLLQASAGRQVADMVDRVAAEGDTQGPYGRFPDSADLRDEDSPGLVLSLDAAAADALGERLTAAVQHAHLLVLRPRESSPKALAALLSAGWSTPQVVTLSQLVAFLSFQLRVVHGLTVLKESNA
jgi:CMD domain protein